LVCSLLLGAALASSALAAQEFPVVEKLVATNCTVSTCGEEDVLGPFFEPKAKITAKEAEEEGVFTTAGGRVPDGITDFKMLTLPEVENEKGEKVPASYATGTVVPTSVVKHIRTDVAPGLATNPFAVERCTGKEFGETEVVPGTGFYPATGPECEKSEIGEQQATVFGGFKKGPGFEKATGAGDIPLSGEVYDVIPGEEEKLENGAKLASLYGVALKLPKELTEAILTGIFAEHPIPIGNFPGDQAEKEAAKEATEEGIEEGQYYAHTLIKGNVEWGKEARGTDAGDFHDYFEINVSTALPLVRSRLIFEGKSGDGAFITNATSCPGNLTTSLRVRDASEGEAPVKSFTTPVGLEKCNEVEFEPHFGVSPASTLSDTPVELSAEASEEHNPAKTDPSQVKSASFTLPEGMTLNPAAAAGLEACTPAQAHQNGTVFNEPFGVGCPGGSKIGTVSLEVPTLPAGSLTGSVYLAGPESGPITEPPYDMYVVANSVKYGVSVRLFAETVPNPLTGQLTAFFRHPPEQPFTSLKINFERGMLTPIANPLVCGEQQGSVSFEPTSAPGTLKTFAFGVPVTGCSSSPPPFVLGQGTENENATAGGHTSYTFSLARADGQQYLQKVRTTLPSGLIGEIPDVTLCAEAQANAGTCGSASRIGTVSVQAGSGSSPYTFNGSVYMTGPYNGAPFGLSIAVPAVAGPFNLGLVVTRASISIDPVTSRVTAESTLPTIVRGVPLRLRSININVNRQGFLLNPTNCQAEATETTLTSTLGAVQGSLNSPFQVEGCGSLAFKPTFSATTSGKTSRLDGASLSTTINQPAGQANIKSVEVTLPTQLVSRQSTNQRACLPQVFAANPYSCPKESWVGSARANTPTLPGKLQGTAFLVARGGAEFPDLDLVMEANNVRAIVKGHTFIHKNRTTTFFEATPDVPVSSITVELPSKEFSAVAPNGDLCTNPLIMPTVITGQNGLQVKQETKLTVKECGVRIVGHKVVGNTAYLTVKTFAPGRVSGTGSGVNGAYRSFAKAQNAIALKVSLNRGGRSRRRPFKVKLRVGFVPKTKGLGSSAAFVTVTFR
jgi:hypothetical protein